MPIAQDLRYALVSMTVETLSPGEVHVWITPVSVLDEDPTLYAEYDHLLTDEERSKQRAFAFERNRRERLLTRALVKTTLSRYRRTEPAAWRFKPNAYGRPCVEPPCGLVFNLSNHATMVVCVVAESIEVGIDVEPLSRADDILDLAPTVFAPSELADLSMLDDEARRDRAVTLWTLKEAYLKARGVGLAIPLESFAFHFDENQKHPRISFVSPIDDDPDRWWFAIRDVHGHRVSVAVERTDGAPSLRVHTCVPLRDRDCIVDPEGD